VQVIGGTLAVVMLGHCVMRGSSGLQRQRGTRMRPHMGLFRLLAAFTIASLLLSSTPPQATPRAQAMAGPARPVAAGPAAPSMAPTLRPRGIPPAGFVPAPRASRLHPCHAPACSQYRLKPILKN
jgi:hypothetical protein